MSLTKAIFKSAGEQITSGRFGSEWAFVFTSTAGIVVAPVEGTYYGVKYGYKLCKFIIEEADAAHERSKEKNRLARSPLTDSDIDEIANCIFKLASCTTGVSISAPLLAVMPHLAVNTAFSAAQLIWLLKRLAELTDKAGGMRKLLDCMSKREIFYQACAGVAIKSFVMLLTLGHDFDIAHSHEILLASARRFKLPEDQKKQLYDAIASTIENDKETMPQAGEGVRRIIALHEQMTAKGPLDKSTEAARLFADEVGKFYADIDCECHPTWGGDAKTEHVVILELADAADSEEGGVVVEELVHQVADEASDFETFKPRGD